MSSPRTDPAPKQTHSIDVVSPPSRIVTQLFSPFGPIERPPGVTTPQSPVRDYPLLGSSALEPSLPDSPFPCSSAQPPVLASKAVVVAVTPRLQYTSMPQAPANAQGMDKGKGKAPQRYVIPQMRAAPHLQPPLSSKPPPKDKSDKPQPPFAPIFARRPLTKPSDIPSTITQHAYIAHETHIPAPTSKICSCATPSCTPELKIAQCSNKECRVGWYHYMCLDKVSKLKANHGTMMCQVCQNERAFAESARKNGWSAEKLVEEEMKVAFSGEEISGAMSVVGRGMVVRNPYGLGREREVLAGSSAVVDAPTTATTATTAERDRGALGSLAFMGYEESRPLVITEAYTNAQAYMKETLDLEQCQERDREEEAGEDEETVEDEHTTLVDEADSVS